MRTKNVRIKKTGDDDYRYSIAHDHIIDEEVSGPALMGVLGGRLFGTTLNAVMARLNGLKNQPRNHSRNTKHSLT